MPDYNALEYFFSAYFHQDWQSEHPDSEAVVDTFRRGESEQQVRDVRDELRRLLDTDLDEDELKALLHGRLQSAWAPTPGGPGYRSWLQGLLARFEA